MAAVQAAEAVAILINLTSAAINLSMQIQKVSMMIQQAQLENRELSDEDWAALFSADDLARMRQEAQIAKM